MCPLSSLNGLQFINFPITHFFFHWQIWSHCVLFILLLNRFLDEVQSYSGINKMSVQNLATVFGPNILRPKVEDPLTIMEGKWITIIYRHQKNSQLSLDCPEPILLWRNKGNKWIHGNSIYGLKFFKCKIFCLRARHFLRSLLNISY